MSEQAMDDVSKFLQDVKEMNARRTEEDDARQRELDEKIQQEKRERQARRAGTSLSVVFRVSPSPPPHCSAPYLALHLPVSVCSFSLPPPSALFMGFLFSPRPRNPNPRRVVRALPPARARALAGAVLCSGSGCPRPESRATDGTASALGKTRATPPRLDAHSQ
ncbi:hypothetical protein LZ30DRAFT_380220 [Colletotrichum cereale]|nr:hypothetical protein LZ30DRAFT_380220 [Colletotrichum cereale]